MLAEVQAGHPQQAFLRPVDLQVDEKAQRALNSTHATAIAADYQPHLAYGGTVSVRETGLFVVDGQHRVEGAKIAQQGDVPVRFDLCYGLDRKAEADLFRKLNDHKLAVSAIAQFMTGVTAGYPECLAIERILHVFGLRVGLVHNAGTVSAIRAITKLYHAKVDGKADGDLLQRTLRIIVDAWGKDHDAYDNLILRALGSVLRRHDGSVDDARMARALSKSSAPAAIIGQIRGLRSIKRLSSEAAGVEIITGIYNVRLAPDARLS